jgi:hypothetical protein
MHIVTILVTMDGGFGLMIEFIGLFDTELD